jgi:hypothetical protein
MAYKQVLLPEKLDKRLKSTLLLLQLKKLKLKLTKPLQAVLKIQLLEKQKEMLR